MWNGGCSWVDADKHSFSLLPASVLVGEQIISGHRDRGSNCGSTGTRVPGPTIPVIRSVLSCIASSVIV